jgi:hypothetical protein
MKQKIYILGLITTLVILTGSMFKVNHMAGASILLTLGMIMLILWFLPVALRNHYRTEGNRQNLLLYVTIWLTCLVVFGGMLFKIMHWPHAGLALIMSLLFPFIVFLPVYLVITSKKENYNIYNTVFVLSMLAVISVYSAMLALNVAKDKIDDSLRLSRNYNRLEKTLDEIPAPAHQSVLIQKIDDALAIVDEYQGLIFSHEGFSEEQWNIGQGNLKKAEEAQVSSPALVTGEDSSLDTRLEDSLNSLMTEINNTSGYEALAKAAPAIFDFTKPSDGQYEWTAKVFQYNTQSWSLIYLDGLETNLKMIKATLH